MTKLQKPPKKVNIASSSPQSQSHSPRVFTLKMTKLSIVIIFAAAASALATRTIIPRDAESVFINLEVIEESYSRDTLISDAQSFDGTLLGAIDFEEQVDIVTVSP